MITHIQTIEFDAIFSIKPFIVMHMAPLFNLDHVLHQHNGNTNMKFKLDPHNSLCGDVHETVIESLLNSFIDNLK